MRYPLANRNNPVNDHDSRHRREQPFIGRHRLVGSQRRWSEAIRGLVGNFRRRAVATTALAAVTLGPVAIAEGVNAPTQGAVDSVAAAVDLGDREQATQTASRSNAREATSTVDALAGLPKLTPQPKPETLAEGTPLTGQEPKQDQRDKKEEKKESKQVAPVAGMSQVQMDRAAAIVKAGQDMDLPEKAYVVAIATSMQESNLRNLASTVYADSFEVPHDGYGSDHDSVGLFQQRPSMGWGTVEQIMDPEYSAKAFFEKLKEVPGWEDMPITKAAQTVQVSAFPDAYAKHVPVAEQIVDALTRS